MTTLSSPEAWSRVRGKYRLGQVVSATVACHLPYGISLAFEAGVFAVVDALSIWNDMSEGRTKGKPPVGAVVQAVIVEFVEDTMEVKLSLRDRDFHRMR